MLEIRLTTVLILVLVVVWTSSAKEWKKEQWNKKYVIPEKGIHYHLPKHPKSHGEHWKGHSHHSSSKHVKEGKKHIPHSVGYHKAKLQTDLEPSRKHVREHYDKWAREDLHLQDLNLERQIKEYKQNHKETHSKHKIGHHEIEGYPKHHLSHLKEQEQELNHKKHDHPHFDIHHHSHHNNRKSSSHHKNNKQKDKSMKNKRKKAYEKKHGKKHSKYHHKW